jgi:hypothetical protein
MSDHKTSQSKNYPLDILKRLLDSPQLLPGENAKEFIQLFDSLEVYGKPQSTRDYMAVYQSNSADLGCPALPADENRSARSHQRPALESQLRQNQVRTVSKKGIGEAVAQSEARQLAAPWFKDPTSRPAMMKTIENASYTL